MALKKLGKKMECGMAGIGVAILNGIMKELFLTFGYYRESSRY